MGEVERKAKLFEAGSYADKQFEVSELDLDNLVTGFQEVPVKVEHSDTPFDGALGTLKKIWREGTELFGNIGFKNEAWALIDAAGARKLSIGIKRDKSALVEVSLVRNPRVSGAEVFDDRVIISGSEIEPNTGADALKFASDILSLLKTSKEDVMPNQNAQNNAETFSKDDVTKLIAEAITNAKAEFSDKLEDERKKNAQLSVQFREQAVNVKIDELKRAGKLIPACEEFAKAILLNAGEAEVTFAEKQTTVPELFVQFMEALPEIVSFGEQGKGKGHKQEEVAFSAEQIAVFKKLGIEPEEVAKHMEAK